MKKGLALLLTFAMLFGVILCDIPNTTFAASGVIYYVDSSNGNDNNNGTSTGAAWKSLDKVNLTTFLPGDQIRFKAGGAWSGTLHPLGSGDSSNQITIDMYGTGDKPLIAGNGATAGVMLDGQEYWTIKNLQVTNTAAARDIRHGIAVIAKQTGITNRIRIQNCDVHDVTGENRRSMPTYKSMYFNGGIFISYPGRSTAANRFDDVLIEGNNVHDVLTSGIRVTQHEDFIIDQYYTNVVVRNNIISKTGSDGMIVANSVNPLIENNACYDAGYNGNTADTKIIAGMWVCGTKNATFQNNEVARTKLFDSDGTAFDTDWGTGGTVIFQYNYTHGNGGGFWLDCAGINKDSTYNKTILRYNISVDDIGYISRNGNENAELYNNVFYKSSGNLNGNFNGTASKHTLKNNIFNFQTSPDWAGAQYDNNCYYPAPANSSDKHAIYGNPDFVNPGLVGDGKSFADNYKIKSTSICINKGINITGNGGKDYWGNTLYYGAPDIGANEYQGEASAMNTLSTDFSTTQGQGNWYYMEWNGSKYVNMTWDSSQNKWKGSYQYNLIWSPSQIHPDSNDSAVAWKAIKAGTVKISGNPKKANTGYDGVNVKIMKNNSQLWPVSGWQFIGGTDTTGVTHEITTNIQAGDMIYFIVNKNVNNNGDETAWNPSIVYKAQ